MLLKLVEATIIVAGFLVVQNLCRFVRFNSRLVCVSLAQSAYAILVYLRCDTFDFSPHTRGFIPFGILFTITLLLGRFLGAKPSRVEFKPSIINIITVGLLLPVSEELLFRGTLLSLFPNPTINGIFFSSFHLFNVVSRFEVFSPYNFVYRFAVGFIFADSTLKTGSLFSAVICHVINNVLAILLPWFEHEAEKRRHHTRGEEDEQ